MGLFARLSTLLLTACCLAFFPAQGLALEPVTLIVRWDAQFQFAGYYEAEWQGFYEEAGLDVTIRHAVQPGGTILQAVHEVVEGRADFGVGAADILVANDRGADLTVLASILQQSAAGLYALAETDMKSPRDLLNLRVARQVDSLIDVEFQAMMRAEGLDPDLVEPYPLKAGIEQLVRGEVDVIPAYSTTIPFIARERELELIHLSLASYGIDFYGDSLFCRREWLDANQGVADRFLKASLEGWEYALAHPQESARRLASSLDRVTPPEDELAFNQFQADKMVYLTHYPYVDVGHVNPARWRMMHQQLWESGLVSGELADDFVYDPEGEEAARRRLWRIVAAAVLIFSLLAGAGISLWAFVLQRTVNQRTRELEESREHYRTVADFTYDWEYWLDPEGTLLYVSPSCERISGYSAADFMQDPELMERLVHPDDRDRFRRRLEIQEQWSRPDFIELRIAHRDGTWRWIGHASQRVYTESGDFLGERGSNRDITRSKKLQEREEEVERILRHDLRSPLVSIHSGLRLVNADRVSEGEKEDILKQLLRLSKRILGTMETLRRLNQIEDGRLRLLLEKRDLGELLREAVEDAGAANDCGDECVRIRRPVEMEGAAPVRVDVHLCRTLFTNLIHNALEAREGEPVSVSIAGFENNDVLVTIHNSGVVPPEVRERFFEKYATSGKAHGTGLGTYSALLAARAHGGDISMVSSEETGTIVTVRLPTGVRQA